MSAKTTSKPRPVDQPDPLLTYHNVAKLAGVKVGTVYQWKKRNLLPDPAPEMIGRRPVWRKSVIETWLEASGRKEDVI